MTLIANGDVALSVSMTTVSTLLAAVVTGPLTKLLVGALVDISAVTLMKATAQVREESNNRESQAARLFFRSEPERRSDA